MSRYNISTHTISQNNHHSNQGNPNNVAYTANNNNHSNQCNPNNSAYHSSRGMIYGKNYDGSWENPYKK